MTPKGGKRLGAGRPTETKRGKRVQVYLAEDLVDWWESVPKREKSGFVNDAIREKLTKAVEQEEREHKEGQG